MTSEKYNASQPAAAPDTPRTAPLSCPNCHDKSDCSSIDICNAVAEVYATPPVVAGTDRAQSLTVVSFDYVNYRGEKSRRNVTPLELRFHSNEYHKEPQFLLRAIDVDKGEEREFAVRDMSNVLPDIFLTGSPASPWPAAPPGADRAAVIEEIVAERARQINQEGWSRDHDDTHADGEMAVAAACYASAPSMVRIEREWVKPDTPKDWPWRHSWWKPGARRRNLIKAAALIIAEIERLDRAALQKDTGK
jgi:hypothetical protein